MLHRRREFRGEFPTAHMDVEQRARETAVSRKRGDFMDVPAGPGEIREAKMTNVCVVKRRTPDIRTASATVFDHDQMLSGRLAFRFDTDKNSAPRARLIARRSCRYEV